MVDMDWQSVVARRAKKVPVSEGGWNAFLTAWAAADILNPVAAAFLAANCDAAAPGWPCDAEMERLRDAFGHETDPAKQKEIAEQVQLRAIEIGTHVWVGQYHKPLAYRKDKIGGWVASPVRAIGNCSEHLTSVLGSKPEQADDSTALPALTVRA